MCEVREIAGELTFWIREAILLLKFRCLLFYLFCYYSKFMNNFDGYNIRFFFLHCQHFVSVRFLFLIK
jgi:hypothetical protein